MQRIEVYKLIDNERDYQKHKWSQVYDDEDWTPNDWLTFIERYVQEGRDHTGDELQQMDAIRKIAALAVAAMEYNPTLGRGRV